MSETLYKGIDWTRRMTVVDDDGEAADLTGLTIQAIVRQRANEAALVTLTVGDGITLQTQSGDTLGQADIVIDGDDSTTWDQAPHRLTVLIDGQVALAPTKLSVLDY
jgi:hypothetical protein